MATKTKKVTKKTTVKVENNTNVVKKINKELINASMAAINTVVDNSSKWQKLASKLIKKSEKVRAQQINMIFDTAEAVKGQFVSGTDKMKDLVGYDDTMVEKAKNMAVNNPVSKKVIDIVEDITEKVSENPMVQKAEKVSDDMKKMGVAKYNELKSDVLEQATKIINKGEALIEEAKETPKAKTTKKVVTAKKTVAKKATAKVGKVTKATSKKATPKKVVAKKATATKKTVTKPVAKATTKAKATVTKKAIAVKKATPTKVADTAVKVAEIKTEVKK